MTTEENKALVREFLERVWNRGDVGAIDAYVAGDYLPHAMPGLHITGPAAYRQAVDLTRAAFPDLQTTFEDVIGEGDRVVVRGTDRATHRGEFMGRPATGRPVTIHWIGIYRVADGKIVEEWLQSDMMGVLQQIGT
jgi:steroid delta-isomerase-like uncharacterized protein